MLTVVDRKVVKHLHQGQTGLYDIPVRFSFQYSIDDLMFVNGSMERSILYNRSVLEPRLISSELDHLDEDIDTTVDTALVEYLRLSGHASGNVVLYPLPLSEPPTEEEPPPEIWLPDRH